MLIVSNNNKVYPTAGVIYHQLHAYLLSPAEHSSCVGNLFAKNVLRSRQEIAMEILNNSKIELMST